MKITCLLSFALYVQTNCIVIQPSDPSLRYVGRFDKQKDKRRFDMNGCEIQFRVVGTSSIAIHLSQRITAHGELRGVRYPANKDNPTWSQPDDFVVFVDGVPTVSSKAAKVCTYCTFSTAGARNETVNSYIVASNLSSSPHEIRVVKATEPEWNDKVPTPNWLTFHGLELDGGVLMAPGTHRRERRLEFIGDSITAGFCNLCHGPGQLNAGEESFIFSWPMRICEELSAECHTVAWSGMGLIRNCCGGDVYMPEVWPRSIATDATSKWNFSAWVPDGLIINLGTNDGTMGTTAEFVEAYKRLVHTIIEAYGKSLDIFLACGPMSNTYCESVHNVITSAKNAGLNAHFLNQSGFLNGTFGPSCCGHPSAMVDHAMAQSGARYIAQVLGWSPGRADDVIV